MPRQSGLVPELTAQIEFTGQFRNPDYVRGIEQYSHLWLIWEFSENLSAGISPTVRPPRLGGNTRVGVFATRSPFRPNPLGLSCVRLLRVDKAQNGSPVLTVAGADLVDGTPIFDIKPYLPYVDCIPGASGGFSEAHKNDSLTVEFPEALLEKISTEKRETLKKVLSLDPRPSYQDDPARVYGISFACLQVHFTVSNGVLTVCGVETQEEEA